MLTCNLLHLNEKLFRGLHPKYVALMIAARKTATDMKEQLRPDFV